MRTDTDCKNVYERFWYPRLVFNKQTKNYVVTQKITKDHHYCFVVTQKASHMKPPSNETIFRRDTRNSRIREFGQWITSFSWEEVFSKSLCQDKFDCFYHILLGAINKYLPMRKVRKCSLDKPWMTDKIKTWIRKRQSCLAKYGKDSSSFKYWRNKVACSSKNVNSCIISLELAI